LATHFVVYAFGSAIPSLSVEIPHALRLVYAHAIKSVEPLFGGGREPTAVGDSQTSTIMLGVPTQNCNGIAVKFHGNLPLVTAYHYFSISLLEGCRVIEALDCFLSYLSHGI